MKAEILAIGTELVSGQKVDTNSAWLCEGLAGIGIEVPFITVAGDDREELLAALRHALTRADIVVIGGGLGPTQDDLTREIVAEAAGVELRQDARCLAALEAFFARRNRPMPERNLTQTYIPAGGEPLENRTGTAPGLWIEVDGRVIACLPGVPSELKIMFAEEVVPRLRGRFNLGSVIGSRKINIFGKGESEVEAMAMDLTFRGRDPEVGITAHDATISFRIRARGATPEAALIASEPTAAIIRERFGDFIVGEGDIDVAEAATALLLGRGVTLATAESCTGGLLGGAITDQGGISACYLGGVVSYTNEAKADLLGVDPALIEAHGAVSPEVAEAMAVGARNRFGADLAISVTGIAGPSGGSPSKPVGLVYLGLASAGGVASRKLELGPEQPRPIIRSRTVKHALNWIRLHLLRNPAASASPSWPS